jgi:glycosyltransferase involved in cell wall biosynthesis
MSTATIPLPPVASFARGTSLRVVHGVLSLDLGGLERLVLDLVRVGQSRGQHVSVVCVERPGRLADEVRALGAEVHSLDKPAGRSPNAVDQATKLLSKLAPDVIHTHQIGALYYLGRAAQRVGPSALVHTEHSDHVRQAKGWYSKLRSRLVWRRDARLARRFCCVSEDVARSVRRWGTVPAGKVSVVLNGIDVDRYGGNEHRAEIRAKWGFAPDHFVVGTVGRLAEVKRHDLLLDSLASILPRFPHARLLIVGDGNERQRLEQKAAELKIDQQVVFAGYQSQPERMLQAMDLFALTSRHEALPLALLEAMAGGLPVVSSAVGGIPQVIGHGRSGLLFASGDIAGLAAALARMIRDPQGAADLAAEGLQVVRTQYSLERMADDYERHYRAAMAAV